ncbi:MAG: signal peptidase I, partial [Clostridia bacterium]|nr:signal peptidase I [Clostridia bacterium]
MLKKSLRIIVDILFVAVFLLLSLFVLMKFMGGSESIFGYNIYYVMTGSMEPKYSSGDILLGKTANPDILKQGDVITYIGDEGEIVDKMITHEIIEIQENNGVRQFITKGIANNLADPPVDESQIQAKILFKIPLLGYVFSIANQKWGFFVVIVLPLAFLVVSE